MKIQHDKNPDPESNWYDRVLVLWEGRTAGAITALERLKGHATIRDLQVIKNIQHDDGLLITLYPGGWVSMYHAGHSKIGLVVKIEPSEEALRSPLRQALASTCSDDDLDRALQEAIDVFRSSLK